MTTIVLLVVVVVGRDLDCLVACLSRLKALAFFMISNRAWMANFTTICGRGSVRRLTNESPGATTPSTVVT